MVQDQPLDSIYQTVGMKVDKVPECQTCQSKVTDDLSPSHLGNMIAGLEFQDDSAIHHEIKPVSRIESHFLVCHGQWHLPLEGNIPQY